MGNVMIAIVVFCIIFLTGYFLYPRNKKAGFCDVFLKVAKTSNSYKNALDICNEMEELEKKQNLSIEYKRSGKNVQ